MDILKMTVTELSKALANKKLTSTEITKSYLDAIREDEKSEKPIHAYVTVFYEKAMEWAKAADELRASGGGGELTGIPIAIKDNINIEGLDTTCSSKILEGYTATYDASVTEILVKREGMVPLGKANMDEFAMGSSTETSAVGITRNPVDRDCIPGGSSGGSAAAVAGYLAPVALGTDTGGSIRQPSSLCGCVGVKPTYGRVSRFGVVAFGSSLDQVGPIARTVEDAALILKKLCEHEKRDATSLELPAPELKMSGEMKGLKIGLPKEYFIDGMDVEVEARIKEVVDGLKEKGAEIVEISLPHTKYAVPTYYIVATAEASANLERFDGIRYGRRAESDRLSEVYLKSRSEGFGDEVKRRIMLGTYVLSAGYYDAYYLKALKVRTLIKNDFDQAFKKVDAIVTPVSPTTAFKLGEKTDDPISMYLADVFTISVNLAGIPAMSVPVGTDKSGLPIGAQVMAKLLDEDTMFNVASVIERK